MGLRYEAWTTPWDPGGFRRKVAMLPVLEGSGQGSVGFLSYPGDSSADISLAGFDRLDDLVSDTESSLITVYDCQPDGTNTIIDEWVLNRVPSRLVPDKTVSLSGPGLLAAFEKALVYAFDYPKNPAVQADWLWGAGDDADNTGLIRNGGFESSPMPNGGFEDGNTGYWERTEADGTLFSTSGIQAIFSAVDARTGDWYGTVLVDNQGDGIRRTFSGLIPGESYTITGWVNEPTGAGDRIRAGIRGASVATHTNAYEDDDYWWAEIGNATQGNGSTTGVYQQITLTFVAAEGSVELVIIYDDVNMLDFNLDDWSFTSGDAVGLDPWYTFAVKGLNPAPQQVVNVFRHDTTQSHSGSGSVRFQGLDDAFYSNFGAINYGSIGFGQDVTMTPGRLYTYTAWVRHNGGGANGANENIRIVLNRLTPSGPLAETVTGEFRPAPGSYYMASKTELVAQNTWTKIQLTVIADVSDIRAEVRYVGSTGRVDVGTRNSPVIWADDISIHEGLPATTIGDIWQKLLDDCSLHHAADRGTVLDWVDYSSFDATLDSNGNPWDTEITFLARWGSNMSHVLDDTFNRGYEAELVRKATPSGGKTHDFHLYNAGGRDDDPSTAVHTAQPVIGGDSVKRNPSATAALVAGPDGSFTEDTDATSLANFGRLETFIQDSEATGPISRQLLADNFFAFESANRNAVRFEVIEAPGVPRPLVDYRPGDTIPMTMAPTLLREDRRVQRVDYRNNHPTEYVVVGSRLLEGEAAAFDLIGRMWRRLNRPSKIEDEQITPGGGGGLGLAIDVAAADAPSWQKAIARYVCDGVDDHIEIQLAIDEQFLAAPADNQSLCQLSSGNFFVDPQIFVHEYVHLRGMGKVSTVIRNQEDGTATGATNPQSSGNFIFDLEQDAELSAMGFLTSFTCELTLVVTDYGIVHDLYHISGQCDSMIYVRGSIQPITHISAWGTYLFATLTITEGWYAISNVVQAGSGPAFFVDTFGAGSISNVSISGSSSTGHGFVIANAGRLAISNVTVQRGVSYAGFFITNNPLWVSLSNVVVNAGWGILASDDFGGMDQMVISNFTCIAGVSAIDMDRGGATQIASARDVIINGFWADGGTGWGIRIRTATNVSNLVISDFDIRDFDEDGISLRYTGTLPPNQKALVHDGFLGSINKHGLIADDVTVDVHDVTVESAGLGAANTYDAFHLAGVMERPKLHHNDIRGAAQLRYGINISEAGISRAIVVGNSGDDPGDFGTDALNDQGTDTQLFYPSDATYGDNFFRSGSTSGADQNEAVGPAGDGSLGREREFAQVITPVQS